MRPYFVPCLLVAVAFLAPSAHAESLEFSSPVEAEVPLPLPPTPDVPLPSIDVPVFIDGQGILAHLKCSYSNGHIHCWGFICETNNSPGPAPVSPGQVGNRMFGIGWDSDLHPSGGPTSWGPYTGVYVSVGGTC
jgi:hypothetical protein